MKKILFGAIGATLLTLLIWQMYTAAQPAQLAAPAAEAENVAGSEPERADAVAPTIERIAVTGTPGAADTPEWQGPVLPAFRYYIEMVQRQPEIIDRWREVRRPASELKSLPAAARAALGVPATGLPGEAVNAGNTGGLRLKAWSVLMDHWRRVAKTTGEDIGGAAAQFLLDCTIPSINSADPPLLDLATCFIGYFYASDSVVQQFSQPLITALRAVDPKSPPPEEFVTPLISILAEASWLERRSALRQQLIELVDLPWLKDHQVAALLVQLTGHSRYRIWADPIRTLLSSSNQAAIWGALEALRLFADRGEIINEQLIQEIPAGLYAHSNLTLRWALYELVSAFGGKPGQAELLRLVFDEQFAYRADALSFLSHRGKVDRRVCLGLVHDQRIDLRDAAIDALGHLGKVDPEALQDLSTITASHPDASVRKLAVRALANSESEAALALIDGALLDSSEAVQLEVVRQIGLYKQPQPERLFKAAQNQALSAATRTSAYRELILDAPDEQAEGIFKAMYADPAPEISAEGYVWQAALAVASRDSAALESWNKLPVPSHLVTQATGIPGIADAVSGVYNVRQSVIDEIERRMGVLNSPEYTEALERKRSREQISSMASNPLIARHLAYEERIQRFMRRRSR